LIGEICGVFFCRWLATENDVFVGFFAGVGEKVVSKTWFLDGEFVVGCVAFVVVWNHGFLA